MAVLLVFGISGAVFLMAFLFIGCLFDVVASHTAAHERESRVVDTTQADC